VESSLNFGRLLRNLVWLALLGFMAVVFAGPVVSAVALILAFALVGFLLWLPLHTLVLGRRAPLRHSFDCGRSASVRVLVGLGAGCRLADQMRRRLGEVIWGLASVAGPMLLEVTSGMVLGGLLVWAYEGPKEDSEAMPLGIFAGMIAGVLVVWSRRRPVAEE